MSPGSISSLPHDLTVRAAQPADLDAMARIHLASFPDAAITMLGQEAARRYYEWQSEPVHDAVALVALDGERLVGFCVGGVFRGALSGFLRRNALFLVGAVSSRPAVLMDARFREKIRTGVRLLGRLARRRATHLFSRNEARLPVAGGPQIRSFGILAIATEPGSQLGGVGRALMAAADAEARRRRFRRMNLSVHPSNERAVRFYEALGWLRVQHRGRWLGEMEHWLEDSPSTDPDQP
jgi:ribosomal protein S18 acetylase RimI-like enzyme